MKRKHWPWVLGGLGVAIAVYVVIGAVTPRHRFIYGLAPISADEAILLTRANEDDATYFWAQLVRADGTVVWSTELTPDAVEESLGFSGIAASADRIVLMAERGEHSEHASTVVIALARSDGERVWEAVVNPDHGPGRINPMLIVDEPRVYALHERKDAEGRQQETVTALALVDGTRLWTPPPTESASGYDFADFALLGPGALVMTNGFLSDGVELDGATGKVRRVLPLRRLGCATPGRVIAGDGANVVLVPRTGADGTVTAAQYPFRGGIFRVIATCDLGPHDDDDHRATRKAHRTT